MPRLAFRLRRRTKNTANAMRRIKMTPTITPTMMRHLDVLCVLLWLALKRAMRLGSRWAAIATVVGMLWGFVWKGIGEKFDDVSILV